MSAEASVGRDEAMSTKERKEIQTALMNCRSKKLRFRIFQLLKLLNLHGRDLRVQRAVDQSYYIQKQQELETLEERLNESLDIVLRFRNNPVQLDNKSHDEQLGQLVERALFYKEKLENCYSHVFARWKMDFVNLKRIVGKTVEVMN